MNSGPKTHLALAAAVAAGSAAFTFGIGSGVASASLCTPSWYHWSGSRLLSDSNPTFDTGVVIPTPTDELKINEVTYTVFDSSDTSRLDPPESHEQFGIAIGGDAVGGLSADLPDDASAAYDTGMHSGVIDAGGVHSSGGTIQARHASLYGHGGSNEFTVVAITVKVVNCAEVVPPPTEPPTTVAESTTTTAKPPVTDPPLAEPKVVVTEPTTAAPIVAETSTTLTEPVLGAVPPAPKRAVSAGHAPTEKAQGLPATGGETGTIALLALLATGLGACLLVVRRRPADS